jgi:hypothetical protein
MSNSRNAYLVRHIRGACVLIGLSVVGLSYRVGIEQLEGLDEGVARGRRRLIGRIGQAILGHHSVAPRVLVEQDPVVLVLTC